MDGSSIQQLNSILSTFSVAVVCVLDEAESLFQHSNFTEEMCISWGAELHEFTRLSCSVLENTSLGLVLCCSHPRARQLFFGGLSEHTKPMHSKYVWAHRAKVWQEKVCAQHVLIPPKWTYEMLYQFIRSRLVASPKRAAPISSTSAEDVMELLLASARVQSGRHISPVLQDEATAFLQAEGNLAVTPITALSSSGAAAADFTATGSLQGSDPGKYIKRHPKQSVHFTLSTSEALQLLLVYSSGKHRVLKQIICNFARVIFPCFDELSGNFCRKQFIERLDKMAHSLSWDILRPLTAAEKAVISSVVAVLPQNTPPLDSTNPFNQSCFQIPTECLLSNTTGQGPNAAKINTDVLYAAADGGGVLLTPRTVVIPSPSVLFRFSEQGADAWLTRWMLFPLSALAEKLELPVAQALVTGAKKLMPPAFQETAPDILMHSSQLGPELQRIRIPDCSATQPPDAHFLDSKRLFEFAKRLRVTQDLHDDAKRADVWEAVVKIVRVAVKDALESSSSELDEGLIWVLNVLLAFTEKKPMRERLRSENVCFAAKEYPDIHGADIIFVRFQKLRSEGAESSSIECLDVHRVQVKTATSKSLQKEVGMIPSPEPFRNAADAANQAIVGFCKSGGLTRTSAERVAGGCQKVAMYIRALRVAAQIGGKAVKVAVSTDESFRQLVRWILDARFNCSAQRVTAAFATTHLLRDQERQKCKVHGITSVDCRDMYSFWGGCGQLARQLRALPFWLPNNFLPGSPTPSLHAFETDSDDIL